MSANRSAAAASVEITSLAHLSDAEILTATRSLVGRSNRLLAELLGQLAEVEARGIHRTRACSSLYTYCIYELRFSEDEAFRRVAAARLVRRFPALLDAIGAGELHLTGLLMLGPHLTEGNVGEVMARAKHRTKREIARLVRMLDPLPAVPARIEPLGPAPARVVPPEPTWEQFVGALCPVRELEAGERPREWGLGDDLAASGHPTEDERLETTDAYTTASNDSEPPAPAAPARVDTDAFGELAMPQHYKVQFTATEEYVRLVEEAKALLSHGAPRVTLEEVQLRALRAFVETLRKQKYGSKVPAGGMPVDSVSSGAVNDSRAPASPAGELPPTPVSDSPSAPRRRGRYLPLAVRRAVAARDGHRCTYLDACGTRCSETRRLEFHHVVPFALDPSHEVSNLTLRCAAHNALAAEEDFGREVVRERKNAARHERIGAQVR